MTTPQMPFSKPTVFYNKYRYWKGGVLLVQIPRKSIEGKQTNIEVIACNLNDYVVNSTTTEQQSEFIKKKIRFIVAPKGTINNTNDGTQATGGLDLFFATMCQENLNGCYVYYRGKKYRLHDMEVSLTHHLEYIGSESGDDTI